ncbi:hypothetical protein COM11_08035 [Bacillus pseudomycoides]|nr:hypothetical protein COM11_08035 [Bacillus pseudomycoides]
MKVKRLDVSGCSDTSIETTTIFQFVLLSKLRTYYRLTIQSLLRKIKSQELMFLFVGSQQIHVYLHKGDVSNWRIQNKKSLLS